MAYFGAIFFANMGGGGGQNYLQKWGRYSRQKKAHKHKFFCPVGLGTTPGFVPGDFTGFVPGTNFGEVPGTNPGLLLILHSRSPANPGLSLGQTRVCPWDKPGAEGRHRKYMWKRFMCLFCSWVLFFDPYDTVNGKPCFRNHTLVKAIFEALKCL